VVKAINYEVGDIMKATIEQPTYLSWAGYYGMMDMSDIFVFYDDVQFFRQSWQQRNKIKSANGNWMWLTVPVFQKYGQKINEVKINNVVNWRRKHWESIYQSYNKAPYFKQYRDDIERIYQSEWGYLSDWNIFIILIVSGLLGIKMPKLVKSSELKGLVGNKTDRLLQVLDRIGADEYITSYGTKVYIDPQKFKDRNIKLRWYEYRPPVYHQVKGEFFPFMSALDLLFNTGEEALRYIREGVHLEENV